MQTQTLEGGFSNAPVQSARAFREIMTAMARPGVITALDGARGPAPLSQAASVLILTLCDPETPIYLAPSVDVPAVRAWVTFHTGAPFVAPDRAQFAVGTWPELTAHDFPIGTPEFPDRSATLIVESGPLAASGAVLKGPGIKTASALSLPETAAFQRNAARFPLGLDYFFTHKDQLAALPRTTQVTTCM
ncbi:phosphonate C-P lyase system protein PhnH [Roseobacter sp. YSTF-M11]|uniref:Phosphonate C-P lyase system protein PhnH n=1 Tax=Roseobacter insulae TaxID=2859783 RepID=A0A9X1JZN7_9RHOB|nr:phosphonate C-P lyase system protein PhnH [Roseobacter insulae]MBW4707369.1 phosphonate C-P lyase system protein PhnH [Roseobacter insulae]